MNGMNKNIFFIVILVISINIVIIFYRYKLNTYKHKIKINDEYFYVYDFHKNKNIKNTFVILPSYSYFDAKTYIEKKKYVKYEANKDFKNLIDNLCKENNRVLVIEYFGYNESGETKRERTSENICEEIHTALKTLNIQNYYLIPHSISGLYTLGYIKRYKNEVQGIIGIDITLPYYFIEACDSNEEYLKIKFETEGKKISQTYINMHNYFWITSNNIKDFSFDKELPVLLFTPISKIEYINDEIKNNRLKTKVIDYLENKITNKKIQKIITLEGNHYLHQTQYKTMSKDILEFVNKA